MDETISGVDIPVSIERLFKLGEFKNLKVKIDSSDLPVEARRSLMLDCIFDAYETFLFHQIIGAELMDEDTSEWEKLLSKLSQMRKDSYLIFKERVK